MPIVEKSGLMKYKDSDGNTTIMYPITTMDNVDGVEEALAEKAATDHTHTKSQISDFPTSMPASDVKAWAKADTKPTYTADEVGADASGAAAQALTDAKTYTNEQIAAIPAPDVSDQIVDAQKLDTPVAATSTNGIAYTATVPGITALTAGQSFIMVPDRISTSVNTTLNVNNLGVKNLRIRSTGYTATTVAPSATNWLASGKPIRVTYDGVFWVADVVADPSKDYTYSTTDLTAGTSALATGKLYFVYE